MYVLYTQLGLSRRTTLMKLNDDKRSVADAINANKQRRNDIQHRTHSALRSAPPLPLIKPFMRSRLSPRDKSSRPQSLPPLPRNPKLTQPHPRQNAQQHQNTRHDHRPMLYTQHFHIKRRPRARTNGRESQHQHHIPAHAMVLPHLLRVLDATVHRGSVILREAHQRLGEDEYVEGKPEDGVRRRKVLVARARLVDLDDDEAGEEGGDAEKVGEEVEGCAGAFLGGRVRGLEDEDGLGGEEEAGGVEELGVLTACWLATGIGVWTYWVRGEEDEVARKDGAPYDCGELDAVRLPTAALLVP